MLRRKSEPKTFMISKSIGVKWLAVLAALLVLARVPDAPGANGGQDERKNVVLILHDSSGPFGWIGGIHARMLANLIGHFDLPYQIVPVECYQPGAIRRA